MYDYNVHAAPVGSGRRLRLRRVLTTTVLLASLGFGGFLALGNLDRASPSSHAEQTDSVALQLPGAPATPAVAPARTETSRIPFEPHVHNRTTKEKPAKTLPARDWTHVTIAPGDNMSLIFARHGFSKKDLHRILGIDVAAKNLRRIKPGQVIMVNVDADGHVLGMIHELDYLRSMQVELENNAYSATIIETEPEIRHATALAKISQSLFLDGQAAGLADNTIMELTDIFGWDIDFVLDVRRGDQFSVVFEEIFKDGEKVKSGKILAAEFVNQGRRHRAVYYSNSDGLAGYYSDAGTAMRKAFLRAPVNFTRISSKFNLQRRHPVLNKIRAHKGVDYAAPHGTPIRATANGKIEFAGSKGGYGRTVVIKNGDSYSTLFAHMSRFARGIKNGVKVKQGQTIGYVGKTGLATGPHLHYEFRVNGIHKNPLKIGLPQALPIEKKYIADFKSKAAPLLAQLDELDNTADSDKLVATVDPEIRRAASRSLSPATQ
ncbi:MAG: M23 family metallopeptidase [Gammaproteobacteria bacterium]